VSHKPIFFKKQVLTIFTTIRRYKSEIEIEDAIHTAILTLKEGFDGQMNENNIEIAVVKEDKTFTILTPSAIADYLQEVE